PKRETVCASFVFQAEDGIRDFHVTGVQTCALPIYTLAARLLGTIPPFSALCAPVRMAREAAPWWETSLALCLMLAAIAVLVVVRSEERRVGKELTAGCTAHTLEEDAIGRMLNHGAM